jgi:long-subunit acyl-CoA synthetase (AMP-forming)
MIRAKNSADGFSTPPPVGSADEVDRQVQRAKQALGSGGLVAGDADQEAELLDYEVAPGWARQHGITEVSLAALAEHSLVVAEVQHAVQAANQRLARVEQVKRFRILPAEWTVESEELTPTLKLKRRVIHGKYAPEIDALYADTT